MSSLFKSDKYQDYLTNPLGEAMFEKACKLFGSSPITGVYHVPASSEAYNEVNEKDPLKGQVYPPFLPSVASNGIDVGKDFDRRSRFDLDSDSAAILAPPLYTYIMSAYSSQPISNVIKSRTGIDHLNYYLRFHNSHGDTSTIKTVHVAFAEKYNQQCDTKSFGICHKSTVMLGMLDFVLTSFNAYLSKEAKKVIQDKPGNTKSPFQKNGSTVWVCIYTC